jgi:DNA-binding MarR family transcriptional regulator
VNDVQATSLPQTLAFLLGTLGAAVTERFSAALEPLDLRPKHAGLLVALDTGGAASQLDVARTMRVAPSLMVALADHLEKLGAIQRVRDPADRRRQVLSLTDQGRDLLNTCLGAARAVDADLAASLTGDQRAALTHALGALATAAGLPR